MLELKLSSLRYILYKFRWRGKLNFELHHSLHFSSHLWYTTVEHQGTLSSTLKFFHSYLKLRQLIVFFQPF